MNRGQTLSATARAAVGLSSIGTSKRLTEAFGQRVILKVHFDQDPDASALGLASYKWALVAVEPLAHIRHQITKGGSSSHNFNHPHRSLPESACREGYRPAAEPFNNSYS